MREVLRRDLVRRNILVVARKHFIRSGERFVLDDVAAEARISPHILRELFRTKEVLIQAIVRPSAEKLKSTLSENAPSDPHEWLVRFVRLFAVADGRVLAAAVHHRYALDGLQMGDYLARVLSAQFRLFADEGHLDAPLEDASQLAHYHIYAVAGVVCAGRARSHYQNFAAQQIARSISLR